MRRVLLVLAMAGVVAMEWSTGVAQAPAGPTEPVEASAEQVVEPTPVTAPTSAVVAPPPPAPPSVPGPGSEAFGTAMAPPEPSLPATVDPVRPDVRVDGVTGASLASVMAIDGVEAAIAVGTLAVSVPSPDGLIPITTLVVEPATFRRFTPDVTANAVGVWERLREGNVVLTPATANTVGAMLGEAATLSGPRASEALRVGALAANGLPPLADGLVSWEVGRRLGASVPDTILISVADDHSTASVRTAVADLLGADAEVLEEPAQQIAPSEVGRTTLEAFTYQSVGDGTIRIDPDWVARHIVSAHVPVFGHVTCHRVMIGQLAGALAEVEAAGLAGELATYDGCWVPRHILWNPNRGISQHAWGLAIDLNAATNGYGVQPTLNPEIVHIFQRWGFRWGGNFSTPDGMHFELVSIIE